MKRGLLALALLLSACNAGRDRYELHFEAPETLASTNGPVVFAVAPGGTVFYAELRTNELSVLGRTREPGRLFTTADRPDSLAVDGRGVVFVATRTKGHRVAIIRYEALRPRVIWNGPTSRFAAHLAMSGDELMLGLGARVLALDPDGDADQTPRVISAGWTDPVVTAGRGERIWVADNGLRGSKERVARGREKDVAKRNRFAPTIPEDTNPSGMTFVNDELLLCSRTHEKVYRLHVGIDEVARWRGQVGELACERDIAAMADGSIVTSAHGELYRYPPA